MRACPRCYQPVSNAGACGACGFHVPSQWLDSNQLAIAMTGARTAGKSVLIGVMMDQFQYFLAERHHSILTELGTTKERFDTKYRKPLLADRNLLPPTPPAEKERVEPLLWSFEIAGQPVCLSLIDAAGEDLETLAPSDSRFRYLGFVDALVALIDPLKVGSVRAVLEDAVSVPKGSGHDLDVLRTVLQARAYHRSEGGPEQVLAVVLSKFDVLQRLREVSAAPWQSIMNRPGSALQRDPSMVEAFDDGVDSALLHQELESLLQLMNAQLVLTAARNAGIPYRLFAMSALGAEPNALTVGRGGIIPFRVLDVLQATLTRKLGIR